MATTKELRDLYLNMNDENQEEVLAKISKHINREYVLLDEDGFSLSIFYGDTHAAAYYENRKAGHSFFDFIGIVDPKLEILVFIARIMQLFGHDLSIFEQQITAESNELFKKLDLSWY